MLNASADIRYLRIDLLGSGYTSALDGIIKSEFDHDAVEVVIRGQRTPAAGPELWMDVVIAIGANLATEAIVYIARKVREAVSSTSLLGCCINEYVVESLDYGCDFVVRANSAAGVDFEGIELSSLFSRMTELVESERVSGRFISKIETPCDLDSSDVGMPVRIVGVGSYSLWLLTYSEGERWPYSLYDAVNGVFIPLEDDLSIVDALNSPDAFYSGR